MCDAYQDEATPCPNEARRAITTIGLTDCQSGLFCARHAVELRRKEARGELEILVDEPIEEEIPFRGEALTGPERMIQDYYGLESREL